MRIYYNLTGTERKSLVSAISQALNAPTKYLGAPSFAYEVGDYHIDKVGTVTGKDNLDLEDALRQKGFNTREREYDEPDTYESGLGGMGALDEIPDIDQHHPGQYANPDTPITDAMQRQMDEVLAFENLRMDGREELGLGRTCRENPQGESGMRASDVPEYDEPDLLTIEIPLEGFTETTLENLRRLIASKAALIKKAIGADALPVERTETTIKFPWFRMGTGSEDVAAYSLFISALCAAAKEQHRVTAKEKSVENEKFAFRVFLIRLGFIGDEYKAARKVLLKKLSGNSAFKNGAPAKAMEETADE